MTQLNLKILSIKGVLLKDEIDMVVVPGLQGDIGINAGDRTFAYLLNSGIVYLFKKDKVYKRYFIVGGSFKSQNDELIIKTDDSIFDLDNLDVSDVKAKISEYESLVESTKNEDSIAYYQKQMEVYNKVIASQNINSYR